MFRVSPYENVGKNELDLFESATTRRRKVPYHSQANKRRHIKGVIELVLHLCSRLHKKMIVKSILMRHYNPITYKSAPWHNGSMAAMFKRWCTRSRTTNKRHISRATFSTPQNLKCRECNGEINTPLYALSWRKIAAHVFESNLCWTKNQVCVFLAQSNTRV